MFWPSFILDGGVYARPSNCSVTAYLALWQKCLETSAWGDAPRSEMRVIDPLPYWPFCFFSVSCLDPCYVIKMTFKMNVMGLWIRRCPEGRTGRSKIQMPLWRNTAEMLADPVKDIRLSEQPASVSYTKSCCLSSKCALLPSCAYVDVSPRY